MAFLLAYKWVILVSLEVLAWAATFFMLYARYGMQSRVWFRISVVLFSITGVIPQVCMGIIDFIATKKIDVFTSIIVVLILYGLTFGKKQVKKLDAWAQAKLANKGLKKASHGEPSKQETSWTPQ